MSMMHVGHVSAMLPAWSSSREDGVSKQSEGLSLPTHCGQKIFKCAHLGFGLQQRGYLARNFTQSAKPPKGTRATHSSDGPVKEGLSFQERVSSNRLQQRLRRHF